MSEGVFTGFCGHGIHLPDDLCLFEAVDAQGRPIPPGHPSQRVLVTNLYNHTQPLIRFEVTDEVTLIERPCPCGSSMGLIDDPQGRLDDTFVYQPALSVHPHLFRSALGQQPTMCENLLQRSEREYVDRHRVLT